MTKPILVVGSINMDLVVQVERHPKPGDTVLGGDTATHPGGKGANQAAAAARAGGNVIMRGLVGSDGYGEKLKEALQAAGVNTTRIDTVEGSSGLAFITVDAAGENMIVVSPGANGKLTPEQVSAELLNGIALIVMQLEVPFETVLHVAQLAHTRGIPVMLNPAPARDLPDTLMTRLAYLVVNEGEASLLSGIDVRDASSAMQAAQLLHTRGAKHVVVTLGGAGLVWFEGEHHGFMPAHEVEVVDTTAAGDAFCGALGAHLAEGSTFQEALRFANAAGALTVTKAGAQPSLPSREEIQVFVTG